MDRTGHKRGILDMVEKQRKLRLFVRSAEINESSFNSRITGRKKIIIVRTC